MDPLIESEAKLLDWRLLWGKKVFSKPVIVLVLLLRKIIEGL